LFIVLSLIIFFLFLFLILLCWILRRLIANNLISFFTILINIISLVLGWRNNCIILCLVLLNLYLIWWDCFIDILGTNLFICCVLIFSFVIIKWCLKIEFVCFWFISDFWVIESYIWMNLNLSQISKIVVICGIWCLNILSWVNLCFILFQHKNSLILSLVLHKYCLINMFWHSLDQTLTLFLFTVCFTFILSRIP